MSKCDVCNVKVGVGQRLWGEHVNGKKHLKNINRSSAEKKNGDKSQGGADPADNRTKEQKRAQRRLGKVKRQDTEGLSFVGKLMEEFPKKQAEELKKKQELENQQELEKQPPGEASKRKVKAPKSKNPRSKATKSKNQDQSREQVEAFLKDAATIEQAVASGVAASGEPYEPYTSKAWIDHFAQNAPTEEQVAILKKHGDFYSNKGLCSNEGLDHTQFIASACFLHSLAQESGGLSKELTFGKVALGHLGHIRSTSVDEWPS